VPDEAHSVTKLEVAGLLVALPYSQLSLANGPVAAGFARGEAAALTGCLVLVQGSGKVV
jgi:hypothetical protein